MSDSPSTSRLLETAEDKSRDVVERAAALDSLKGRCDVPVERITALLENEGDPVMIMAAAGVLGRLGDPKALPALEKLQRSRPDLPGQVTASIRMAIEACKKRSR